MLLLDLLAELPNSREIEACGTALTTVRRNRKVLGACCTCRLTRLVSKEDIVQLKSDPRR